MKKLYYISILLCLSFYSISQQVRIDANNINALIQPNATFFQDSDTTTPGFEALKGTRRSTIFASSIWMGGLRPDSTLAIVYKKYNNSSWSTQPDSYSTGPLSVVIGSGGATKRDFGPATIDSATKIKWDKVFVVTKSDIEIFKLWYACSNDPTCNTSVHYPGYAIPSSILDWPAHGDVALNQDFYLAPFWDNNSDGSYNPADGDFPCIKGDKYAWFILNDKGLNYSTDSIGVEIHVEVYSFSKDSSNPIDRTLFVGYDIINRSTHSYSDFIVTQFTDFNLGCSSDDYIGSMPSLNSFYGYNADAIDNNCSGSLKPYGLNPPAQGVTFLNQSLSSSVYFNNSVGSHGDPSVAIEYYNYMKGLWKDGTSIKYGGISSGINTTHTFPYLPPTGMAPWTESTAGNPSGDRRNTGSTGPFTFTPGDVIEIDLAYTFSRSDSGNLKSVDQLYRDIQKVQAFYNDSIIPCTDSLMGTLSINTEKLSDIKIYPNPTSDFITIESEMAKKISIEIIDLQGRMIESIPSTEINKKISISHLKNGIYLIKVKNENSKFSVLRMVKN